MSGAEIRAEVAAGIAEAGAEVGDGSPLTATLNKPGPPTGPPYDPQPGEPVPHPITAIRTNLDIEDRDGSLVQADDIMLLVSAEGAPEPSMEDTITLGGVTYQIVNIQPLRPGSVSLLWKIQCRK